MKTAAYLSVNFLLILSWHCFLYSRANHINFSDRLLGVFVICISQIVVTEMFLGIVVQKLHATPLFWTNSVISLLVLFFAMIFRNGNPDECNGSALSVFSNAALETKEKISEILQIFRDDKTLILVSLLFMASLGWMFFTAYLFPSYTWDALWYHLPIVGYILQSGAILENPSPLFIDVFINIFPKNIELFFVWNAIFLQSDTLIDLSQLLFALAGMVALYSMSIKLGYEKGHGMYAGFLFFFTPIVILQSTTNYIDIAVSALFLITVNFCLTGRNDQALAGSKNEKSRLILAGITAGLLLGSKGSGPLFIIVITVVYCLREAARKLGIVNDLQVQTGAHFLKNRIVSFLILFLAPAVLMGGYWYAKNWFIYGNPVYPMEISFLGNIIFKGLYGGMIDPVPPLLEAINPMLRPVYVWMEKVDYYLYDSRLSGFGPAWFILLLPSVMFAVPLAIKQRRHGFLFVLILITGMFILYPRNWNTRYVIFFTGLGCLSFAFLLNYFQERKNVLKTFAFLLILYTFFSSHSPCVTPEKIVEFMELTPHERTISNHAPFNIDLHARQEYGHWLWISRTITGKDTLAFTFEPLFHGPLWNRGFTNRIAYVTSNDFNELSGKLNKLRATHLLVRRNAPEHVWIMKFNKLAGTSPSWLGLTERFKAVYKDENYLVYAIGRGRKEIGS